MGGKNKIELSKEDLELLNSKIGLQALLRKDEIHLEKLLKKLKRKTVFREKQAELIKLQNWVIKNDKKLVILFEGRDAAGKTGAIRRITEHINPRHYRVVALDKPTEDERLQWYFQRYINELPKPGEIVFFDRSWYNRAVVEPVNGFCSEKEYEIFMSQVVDFEKMIVEANTYLIKFYFSISKKEQAQRFDVVKNNPLIGWNFTEVDKNAQGLWDKYSTYIKKMFKDTDMNLSPWIKINANSKSKARLKAINHILDKIPYLKP